MSEERIQVVVAMDFADELVESLAALAPRLRVERHFPQVPSSVWADTEVLYASRLIPLPEQAPRLRWIQLHSAGINHLLGKPILAAEDVAITTASGIHATPIAEHCLAMMLAFACRLPHFQRRQAAAEWDRSGRTSDTLRGQTLGIVGYGSIGRELARLADCLGMTVVAMRRDLRQCGTLRNAMRNAIWNRASVIHRQKSRRGSIRLRRWPRCWASAILSP